MSRLFKRGLWLSLFFATVLGFAASAEAVSLFSLEDTNIANDNGAGPNTVNNRGDYMEIRNLAQAPPGTAIRRRLGYVKFDITGVEAAQFGEATLSFNMPTGRNGAGTMSIWGLIDGVTNTDNPAFSEANWFSYQNASGVATTFNGTPTAPADGLSWSKGLGVNPALSSTDATGALGINPAEAVLLGTITIPTPVAATDTYVISNTTDLPLGSFLSADTNDRVTFILGDANGPLPGPEWRVTSRNPANSIQDALSTALNFGEITPIVPGDTDGDGIVEPEDLTPIRTNWRQTGKTRPEGNLTGDAGGLVDFADFREWKTAILAGGGALTDMDLSFVSVPEPSSVLLIAMGLLGLVSTARARARVF